MMSVIVGAVLLVATIPVAHTSYAQAGPTTPPSVYESAIAYINRVLPDIGWPDSWRHEVIGRVSDDALSCPLIASMQQIQPVTVYKIWLRYGTTEYLLHVTEDGAGVVPCDPVLLGVPAPTGNTTDVQSSCLIDATLANVRSTPDSTANNNIIGELRNGTAPAIGRTADNLWYQVVLSNGITGWIAAGASTAIGPCDQLPVVGVSAQEFGPCPPNFVPDYLPPRINVGDTARIIAGGDPNVVRQQPTRSAERVGLLNGGTQITVLSGPLCGGGYVWWQVTDGNIIGWTVESYQPQNDYYIELVQSGGNVGTGSTSSIGSSGNDSSTIPSAPVLRNDAPFITSENVAALAPILDLNLNDATHVRYDPLSRYLAVINGAGVEMYYYPEYSLISDLTSLLTPTNPNIRTTALEFTPDGRYLVMGYNLGTLWAIDLETGRVFRLAPELQSTVNVIRFDANNRMVVGTGDLFNPTAQAQFGVYDFSRLNPETGEVPRLVTVFSEEGPVLDAILVGEHTAAYTTSNSLHIIDVNTGAMLYEQALTEAPSLLAHANGFGSFDDLLVTMKVGNTLTLLGWDEGDAILQPITPLADFIRPTALAVLPAAPQGVPLLLVAGETPNGIEELAIYQNVPPLRLVNFTLNVRDVALSADGQNVAVVLLRDNIPTVHIFAIPQ